MFGKFLRIVGIVLLGITAVITLLSGVGTTCVALDPIKYEMDAIAPYQWLYILYVIVGIIIGVMGIIAVIALIKSKPTAYRTALNALVLGLITGGLHMATSRGLRGSSMPLDFIVYATAFTLIVFLLFRIPGVWNQINFTGKDDDTSGLGAGVAMIIGGIVILTVQYWAGLTHMINGINYADVWHTPLAIIGGILTILGIILLPNATMSITSPHPSRRFEGQPIHIPK
ncbi:MAG: hypothetical protein GY805_35290 [Chloroflexi bacterium]|nr:hypothetical protein [Chloroflexota bacterium]